MKTSNPKTRWTLILCALVLLFALAFFLVPLAQTHVVGPAKGWYNRAFRTPAILTASFVEDLNVQQPGPQVEKLLNAYRSKKGSYGLRRTVTSVDGARLRKCLATEDGKLTFVVDTTRDPSGTREFSVAHPEGLNPAPEANAARGSTAAPPPIPLYLVSYMSGRGVFF